MTKAVLTVLDMASLGGRARASRLSPEDRSEAARKAANAKWEKYYKMNPEKKKRKKAA
jgi:hypothetical protein